jgi:membrane fusion protein (multidrug efflux system)
MWYALFLGLFFLFSCQSVEKPSPPAPVGVTIYTVEPKTLPLVFDFLGFAESSHLVEIRARVEGYLDKIAYDEGQLVHEEDLLFLLDPKPFVAKVEQAKGEVARQEALVENAKLTVNRLTPLYKQNAASKKDLDNATSNLLATEASRQSAMAQLLEAEINLGYTRITSPITGFSNRSTYREGALINPGANSLLTTVSILDPIWVYFTVSDNDILRARQQEAQKILILPQSDDIALPKNNAYDAVAVMSDGSELPYKGKVDFSAPTYDQSTGTLLVRAVFPNPDAELRPGQFVRIKLHGAQLPDALAIPRRALLQKAHGMFVYLVDESGKVVIQDVSTGAWEGDYQIITNGLKPGDKVIVDGINKVRPGVPVHIDGIWSK